MVAALADSAAAGHDPLVALATSLMHTSEVAAWRRRIARAVPDDAQQRAVAAYPP